MPKTPILDREGFFTVIPGGSIKDLDWNLVNTEVGACVEPRQIAMIDAATKVTQVDFVDASFTRRTQIDANKFYSLLGTDGPQIPGDYTL